MSEADTPSQCRLQSRLRGALPTPDLHPMHVLWALRWWVSITGACLLFAGGLWKTVATSKQVVETKPRERR